MIKKISLMLFFLLIVTLSFAETVKIGYFYIEPFVYEQPNSKTPAGATVEFWEKHIAPAMGVSVEWVGPLPIVRMYKDLETGKIDTAAVSVKNPEREKAYLFPNRPYLKSSSCIVLLKTHPLQKITKADDLFNLNVGYLQGANMTPIMKNDKIKIDLVSSPEWKKINFSKLQSKRIDAIYDNNEYTLPFEANKEGISDKIKVLLLPVDPQYSFNPFTRNARGKKLLQLYNKSMESLYNKGIFEQLVKKQVGM